MATVLQCVVLGAIHPDMFGCNEGITQILLVIAKTGM